MARRKKNSDDRSYLFTRDQKIEKIRDAFPELRRLMRDKAAKQAEHIKPLTDSINALTLRLKAETAVEKADWWPDFLTYMRDQDASDMEPADAERIAENQRLVHEAVRNAEQLSFLDGLELPALQAGAGEERGDTDDDDVPFDQDETGAIETEDGDGQPAIAELDGAPEPEEAWQVQPPAGMTADGEDEGSAEDSDWGANEVGTAKDTDEDAGRAFALGEEAGRAGKPDVKAILKEHGKHHASVWGKACKAGHAKGMKAFKQMMKNGAERPVDLQPIGQVTVSIDATTPSAPEPAPAAQDDDSDDGGIFSQTAERDDNVVALKPLVPLPAVETGVLTSGGDRA